MTSVYFPNKSSIASKLVLVECLVGKCGRTAIGKHREERNMLQVFVYVTSLATHNL